MWIKLILTATFENGEWAEWDPANEVGLHTGDILSFLEDGDETIIHLRHMDHGLNTDAFRALIKFDVLMEMLNGTQR